MPKQATDLLDLIRPVEWARTSRPEAASHAFAGDDKRSLCNQQDREKVDTLGFKASGCVRCVKLVDKRERTLKRRLCGRKLDFWKRKATELVVEQLLRASLVDRRSIVGDLAASRLLQLASSEDHEVFEKMIKKRGRALSGMQMILTDMLDAPDTSTLGTSTLGRAARASRLGKKAR